MAQSVQTLPSPAELTEDQLASQANAAPQESGSANYTIGVSITNVRGQVQLSGFSTGAVGRYDFIGLYKGSFPSDPNSNIETYQYVTSGLPYLTNRTFGPGWVAAYVSFDYARGRYVYQAQVGPTT